MKNKNINASVPFHPHSVFSSSAASGYVHGSTVLTPMNRQTSSVHDHMCLMLNAPKTLVRAQSDEQIRPAIAEENRKVSVENVLYLAITNHATFGGG